MLLQVNDRVAHVSYPKISGTVVGRYRNSKMGQHIYLVLWKNHVSRIQRNSTSRHIGSALRKLG